LINCFISTPMKLNHVSAVVGEHVFHVKSPVGLVNTNSD
jgi:hypothetical protein